MWMVISNGNGINQIEIRKQQMSMKYQYQKSEINSKGKWTSKTKENSMKWNEMKWKQSISFA